jgi:LysR family transcriptional regulator, glycine cleavage system transcriptional activator
MPAREDIDLAIRHGDGVWPGLHVTRLCTEELFPVCSPAFLRGRSALRDIRQHTLLHTNNSDDWTRWFGSAGLNRIDVTRGIVFNQASMAIDAAVDGQGVALARTALASSDMIAGRLLRPFTHALAAPYAFWIVCPEPAAALPKTAAFRRWLLQEAAADARRLAAMQPKTTEKN